MGRGAGNFFPTIPNFERGGAAKLQRGQNFSGPSLKQNEVPGSNYHLK
jgi:hypothetical protein